VAPYQAAKLSAAMKPVLTATQQMQDRIRNVAGAIGAIGKNAELARMAAAAQPAFGAIGKLQEQARLIREQMQPAIGALGANAALSRQLADQFKAIDSFKSANSFTAPDFGPPARSPTFDMPVIKNPIVETNKRLANIEKQFQRMGAIAAESATIATSLQASAAGFLSKFESVAADNDRTTKRAVLIGVIAIFIAVVTSIVPIIYTEYWRAPSDAAAAQIVVTDLKNDIYELRKTQRDAAERLSETMAQSNGELSTTLKEIRDLLAKQNHAATLPGNP
jgi:hypothetical protein